MMAFWCDVCRDWVFEGDQRDGDLEFSGLNNYNGERTLVLIE